MFKDKAKLKAKKRRNFSNISANVGKNQQCPKCKKVIKPSGDDGISKSKQPAQKKQANKSIGKPKTRASIIVEPKICGNVKPMPSLSDQEKMFEDSEDEELKGNNNSVSRPMSNVAHWPTFSDLERMFEDSDDDD